MRIPKLVDTQAGQRWVVRYRDAAGWQSSQRFDEDVEAQKFALDLDRYGSARAEQMLYARLVPDASQAAKLNEWIDTYISTRSRASAGTRAKYRTSWLRSFGPRLGHLPIDQITGDDVARAVMDLSEVEGL